MQKTRMRIASALNRHPALDRCQTFPFSMLYLCFATLELLFLNLNKYFTFHMTMNYLFAMLLH